jgi:6-phosphogluconolactonase
MRLLSTLAFAPLLSAQLMYVGTYTKPQSTSEGIYAFRFDAKTAKFAPLGLVAPGTNPSFLAVHPNGNFLYAVNEVIDFGGKSAGAVSAYSIDKATGKLKLLNQVSSGGAGPCHLTLDATGKTLLVANYFGGSFASFQVQADGKLSQATSFIQEKGHSVNKERQEQSHGHMMVIPKNNKFALGADLGADKVLVYKLDAAAGKITPNEPSAGTVKPGSGPRHLVVAPDQKHVYVLNEMGSSVSTMDFDADKGTLKELAQVSTLPAGFKGVNSGAEIQISEDGHFVYASNRGHNSIAVFAVDPKTAALTLVQNEATGGKTPRGFTLDPTGNFLVAGNQDTNTFTLHKVDKATGKLSPAGEPISLGAPVSFVFVK